MSTPVKRTYDSSGRSRQAQETRERVSRVAHDLFVERGYGNTTIADVARAAGVSAETIYKAFGTKAELLRSAWFVMFRGDSDATTMYDRPETQEVLRLPDLADRIDGFARLSAERSRRSTPLRRAIEGAAANEPAARAMLDVWHERILDVATRFAHAAAETGQLACSEAECRDVTYSMLDGTLWQRLVVERGWSDDRYAHWLARQWKSQFVADQAGRAHPRNS